MRLFYWLCAFERTKIGKNIWFQQIGKNSQNRCFISPKVDRHIVESYKEESRIPKERLIFLDIMHGIFIILVV
jgi:hypothetical protein